ncbi:MAG: 1-acyl-sn-glycerol-3-phosphate acyltransferase [Clostridia bacterium]|nr:1-acyl-sn-glycerol-3-phosphate acyltransferase [Clostridia bacterium]
MEDSIVRFDMKKPPRKCMWFLKPVAWLLCIPGVIAHRTKIEKIGIKGLKPPYLLLGNHNAFFDMKVSGWATFPKFGNYVVAIDGFIGREWLLRSIGCICKRKFTNDLYLIKHLRRVIDQKGIAVIYPEARYSLCGTTAPLPGGLGRLCKMLNVPVVTLICHGHHINHPFWNTRRERGVKPTEATMELLLRPEDLQKMSEAEINRLLVKQFQYDDFQWQKDRGIRVADPNRAQGLEKILYQCPCCRTEYRMRSEGVELFCDACGKRWRMSELGELSAENGETEFSHIPDWYEWERDNVRHEVESGTYSTGLLPVHVKSLPNAKRFIDLGHGTMIHDENGFTVRVERENGQTQEMRKTVPSLYSCHIEYEYLFRYGDCVDLNTLDDTWYVFPEEVPFSVTKMALATEELYYRYRREIGKPCEDGLA